MAIEITAREDYIEVRVSGKPSVREILMTIKQLRDRDPRKEMSDLWLFSEDSILPIDTFPMMAENISFLCAENMACSRSAIVVTNAFQKATFDFVKYEAHVLPYEIEVFTSAEKAIEWIREKPVRRQSLTDSV